MEGKGEYEAALVFNEAERKLFASGNVKAAAPKSVAEQQGKRRAKDRISPPTAANRTATEPAIGAPGRKRI